MLPGQVAGTKLNPKQSQAMISHAVREPWQNAKFVTEDGFSTVGLSQQANPLLV